MIQKKQYNAIDLLKFIMALLVIMIHVKPNTHCDLLNHFFTPLMSIAVPVFFIISSLLFFRKLNNANSGGVVAYCKRIGLLYFFWFLIDFWFIWNNKPYFRLGLIEGGCELLKDLIFATTFPGSWYLSASVVGVVLVFLLSRLIHPVSVFILSFLMAIYVLRINDFPDSMRVVYDWYALHFRSEVNLSFPAQLVWIFAGQLLSMVVGKIEDSKRWLLGVAFGTFILAFVTSLFQTLFELHLLMALSLVVACLLKELPSSPIYRLLRNYSILMFFFHFSIAGKMGYFTRMVGDSFFTNWLYYVFVVALSILFAHVVLTLEKIKYLRFLKYTH